MQRRAAAIYVAFFLIVGAASYSLIATATAPTIEFDNPEEQLQQNDTFTVDDQQYRVSELSATMEGGGHGSAARIVRSGAVVWTNQSVTYTQTWENNSTVTVDQEDWRVVIPNATDPSSFTLREEINETRILEQDPNADNETLTRNGERYVVITEDGEQRLVPANEYFPDPSRTSYDEGQTIDYRGNQTTFANVSTDAVTLEWTAPRDETIELADQSNVTIGDQTYLVHFEDNETVVLTQNFASFNEQSNAIETYHEQVNGLWGISILSFGTAILLAGMAYLPSRY